MTVIVAAITKTQGVVVAADGQWSTPWQRLYRNEPKIWTAEKFAMGGTGSGRVGQILKHHVKWPKYRPEEDIDWEAYLVKTVVPAIRAGTKDHGIIKTENGVESIESELVIAAGDRLAVIWGSGCALSETSGRAAIGSGYGEAIGHLGDTGPWKEADVIEAVRRASGTARGVGGPISVVDTKTLTVRKVEP